MPPAPWGTGVSQPEDLTVAMVTFGPGDDLPSWWGHSAVVVTDTKLRQARIYNYGMFDFSTGFVHKFVQGRLEFWVADSPYVFETFGMYRNFDRDVRIQELRLQPAQAAKLAKLLADNVLPANRDYLYHHYNDNCSTRPRDLIDQALDGQLSKFEAVPSRMSLREHTRRYSQVFPPMSLVLDYLQNDELDRKITKREEAFLPDELEIQLDQLQVTTPDGTMAPAVAKKTYFYKALHRDPVPTEPPHWNVPLFLTGLLFGGLTFGLARWTRGGKRLPRVLLGLWNALLGLGWGSLGVFLFIVGIWTNHSVAHHNENLFLINPITFALLPLGIMQLAGAKRGTVALQWAWVALAVVTVVGLVAKVLPALDQQNWNLICLVLPVNVLGAIAFRLLHRWQRTAVWTLR
jgi:hypothetical protein